VPISGGVHKVSIAESGFCFKRFRSLAAASAICASDSCASGSTDLGVSNLERQKGGEALGSSPLNLVN